jgi:hypothetical protein
LLLVKRMPKATGRAMLEALMRDLQAVWRRLENVVVDALLVAPPSQAPRTVQPAHPGRCLSRFCLGRAIHPHHHLLTPAEAA